MSIPIIDNHDWQPDLSFNVELYNPNTEEKVRFPGDDTICRVTILDEDNPGVLSFQETELRVSRHQSKVDIVVQRNDGSDGRVACYIYTA